MKGRRTYRSSQKDFERYLEKEMAPDEAHDFERATLDDAFEEEALQGWESQELAQSKEDLKLLKARVASQSRSTFPVWRVAAAVSLLLVGTFVTYQLLEDSKEAIALKEVVPAPEKTEQPKVFKEETPKPEKPVLDASESRLQVDEETPVASEGSQAQVTQEDEPMAEIESEDFASIEEPSISAANSVAEQATSGVEVGDELSGESEPVALAQQSREQSETFQLAEEVEEDALFFADQLESKPESTSLRPVTAAQPIIPDSILIEGVVFDPFNRVVSNVDIVVDGTQLRTKSGIDGKYELKVPDNMADRIIRYELNGFTSEERTVANSGEINIQLQSELAESAADDDQVRKRARTTGAVSRAAPVEAAQPEQGYQNYIEQLHRTIKEDYRDRKLSTGIVTMTATVQVDGSLTNLLVTEGIDEETDAVALEVVRKGPKWRPILENGRPTASQVEIVIPFR